jgi:elongation factor P
MVDTSDFRSGLNIIIDDEIHTILDYQQSHQGRGSAIVRVRLKRLRDGAIYERTFKSGERFPQAYLERKLMQTLYRDGDEWVVMDTHTFDQIHVPVSQFGEGAKFLKDGMEVYLLYFNDQIVGADVPDFVELAVAETDPNFRGDTASGGSKPAKLETGAVIQVPFHIEVGDVLKVNTREGVYVERVRKGGG